VPGEPAAGFRDADLFLDEGRYFLANEHIFQADQEIIDKSPG